MKKIGIINAGSGNIGSVAKTFQLEGSISDILIRSPKVDDYDLVILPGVGSAGSINKYLNKYFREWISERAELNKSILGICLGFQLMFQGTQESGGIEGLSFFKGICEPLSNYEQIDMRVGWYKTRSFNLGSEANYHYYYFNHAYGINLNKQTNIGKFGKIGNSISWIRKKNIFGCQFHPEKSQISGKYLIRKIIEKL